jgi:glycosyltransferase involved in cell wall biosynthesis
MQRTHFLGKIPYDSYRKVLQVSSAHVYLSYPFVLSWSCLEAMSSGCVVVGSKTPPVQEVIEHGKNGYLVDFFDLDNLTDTVLEVLRDESGQKHIRQQAREHVRSRYGLGQGQYAYDRLLMP